MLKASCQSWGINSLWLKIPLPCKILVNEVTRCDGNPHGDHNLISRKGVNFCSARSRFGFFPSEINALNGLAVYQWANTAATSRCFPALFRESLQWWIASWHSKGCLSKSYLNLDFSREFGVFFCFFLFLSFFLRIELDCLAILASLALTGKW